jgi:hypothetical protein
MGRAPRPEHAISVREIELQLRGRVEAVVRECLPNAVREGPYMKVGSVGGERGNSLVVHLQGESKGMWNDYGATPKTPAGSGDMLGMIAVTKFGGELGEAVKWAKSWLGLDHLDPGRLATIRAETQAHDEAADAAAAREEEGKKRGARALWLNGTALNGVCPASLYLEGRGLVVPEGRWPGSLRYHSEVWNRDAGVKLPCMVATMVTPAGAHVATHRTWLGREPGARRWVKADGADLGVPRGSAKKVLGKCGGAFVPIAKGASKRSMGEIVAGETLYVTEGIEDALTVMMAKPGARVIAGYSLRNLGMIEFPPAIETIVLVADRDDGDREIEALERAIGRQQARGHRVQLVMPPEGIKDINAWLSAGQALGRAA